MWINFSLRFWLKKYMEELRMPSAPDPIILLKPSKLIHIAHNLSLLQSQLWDYILSQTSREEILTQSGMHQISIAKILKFLGNTRNTNHVQHVLVDMHRKSTYTVITKDGSDRGAFMLFNYAYVKDGIFYYSYDPIVAKFIVSKLEHYTRINLSTVLKFDSRYALFLYQLCLDFHATAQTPWLNIETFCNYMCIDVDRYESFAALNYDIIKNAIKEVNQRSELIIKPVFQNVTGDVFKKINYGKKIAATKFMVRTKNTLNTIIA